MLSSKSASQPQAEHTTVLFEPGKHGVLYDPKIGLVIEVGQRTQAGFLGVKAGWKILKLDDADFSENKFKELENGKSSYTITLDTEDKDFVEQVPYTKTRELKRSLSKLEDGEFEFVAIKAGNSPLTIPGIPDFMSLHKFVILKFKNAKTGANKFMKIDWGSDGFTHVVQDTDDVFPAYADPKVEEAGKYFAQVGGVTVGTAVGAGAACTTVGAGGWLASSWSAWGTAATTQSVMYTGAGGAATAATDAALAATFGGTTAAGATTAAAWSFAAVAGIVGGIVVAGGAAGYGGYRLYNWYTEPDYETVLIRTRKLRQWLDTFHPEDKALTYSLLSNNCHHVANMIHREATAKAAPRSNS